MRKKILSLLLIAALVVGLLAGCSKNIPLKDVKSDPAAYIEAGIKKSLGKSPIGSLIELKDSEALSLAAKIAPSEEEGHVKFDAIVDHKNFAALIGLDVLIEGEAIKGNLFVDKENIALKSELLTQIFGSDAVGIGLKDFASELKESVWYDLFVVQSGLEEMLKNDDGEDIDIQTIIDLCADLAKDIEGLSKECVSYAVVEDKLTIDGKEIKCFKITQKAADDFETKLEDTFNKFVEKLDKQLPGESIDLDDEFSDVLDEVKSNAEIIYFISQESGALLEIRYKDSKTSIDEFTEESITSSVDIVVNFGKDPEAVFAPQSEIVVVDDDVKTTIAIDSEVNKSAKSLEFTINANVDYPDDDEWYEDQSLTATISLDKDGNYKLAVSSDEEEYEFAGKFKVDGSKIQFTANIDDGEEVVEVEIELDFNAKKPTGFEYDDLMKWDEEKITNLLEKLQ